MIFNGRALNAECYAGFGTFKNNFKALERTVTFKTYPESARTILGLRQEINKEIKKCI